ncbi:MAG: type II toxin-antitoxin system VapC family toxin [Acidimicrobiales bacterium]
MDAFDADVLIYAAVADHHLGRRVRPLLAGTRPAGVGSLLLLPELLSKPWRDRALAELTELAGLLARLELRPVDRATADLAVALGAQHRLHAADAVHLATAMVAGADRFITNNRKDFTRAITGIEVVYPQDLPAPAR